MVQSEFTEKQSKSFSDLRLADFALDNILLYNT